jgi:hypothetical protein
MKRKSSRVDKITINQVLNERFGSFYSDLKTLNVFLNWFWISNLSWQGIAIVENYFHDEISPLFTFVSIKMNKFLKYKTEHFFVIIEGIIFLF